MRLSATLFDSLEKGTKPMTLENMIDFYIKLRDKQDEIKAEMKLRLAELQGHMDTIEKAVDNLLGTTQSARTEAGTAYRTRTMRANVTDRDAWFGFIQTSQHWNFLTKHVATGEVQAYLQETGGPPPPGLALSEILSINFRRG